MYFTAESCLHIINYVRRPETDQNMPYLSPYHWPVSTLQNSPKTQKFGRKRQMPRLGSKFCILQNTMVPISQYFCYKLDWRTFLWWFLRFLSHTHANFFTYC